MIRLTLALLATLYFGFMIAGQDHGQMRYGLMGKSAAVEPTSPSQPEILVAADPAPPAPPQSETLGLVQAVYMPAQPMVTESQVAPTAAPVSAEPDQNADIEQKYELRFIAVSSANVRQGPSRDFAVIEKLPRGEAVSVISASQGPGGWTLIRIEGDGLQGYVWNALLSDEP